jgi:hypothetical protein
MKPLKLTREEVAQTLEGFINGTGGQWDWDDFMSSPIEDNKLELIRLRSSGLDSEFPPKQIGSFCNEAGLEVIRSYIAELRTQDK